MNLTAQQRGIIQAIANSNKQVIKVNGSAGCGKSVLISALKSALSDVVVVAPTHKAASVLAQRGCPASTIHSEFFTCTNAYDDTLVIHESDWLGPDYKKLVTKPAPLSFTANDELEDTNRRTAAHITVIDEASMVPTWMIQAVIRMSEQVILVGDDKQLPPINDRQYPRGYFNSLSAAHSLTENFRQTDNALLTALDMLATQSGRHKPVWAQIQSVNLQHFSEFYLTYRPKIICWTNKSVERFNNMVRAVLGYGPAPVEGEPVILNKAYTSVQGHYLHNGLEGKITHDRDGIYALFGKELLDITNIEFGRHTLNYAYAITTHKAQGSEWPVTLVLNEAGVLQFLAEKRQADTEAQFQLNSVNDPAVRAKYKHWLEHRITPAEASRRWAYTALTRGREVFHTTTKGFVK